MTAILKQDGSRHDCILAGNGMIESGCVHKLSDEDQHQMMKYIWPGGYPVYYITEENETVCAECANHETSDPVEYWTVNYEDDDLYCADCNEKIESAYGGSDAQDE